MKEFEKIFELFNEKNYSLLLKRKLDYICSLYEDCKNSKEYSVVHEIVENFSEIIFIMEMEKNDSDITNAEIKADTEEPDFQSLNNIIEGREINDDAIVAAFDDYMTRDALINHHKQPSESTIKDYIKRLKRYAREYRNGISITELYENIEIHINDYLNNAENTERNKKQHGAELSALKKLRNMKAFIDDIHRKESLKKYLTEYMSKNLRTNSDELFFESEGNYDFSNNGSPLMHKLITLEQQEMLKNKIKNRKGFFETLCEFIDERNLKDSYVYKKAGISRNVFSRIRKGERPSKESAMMLALALELNYDDFHYLLESAGYALSTDDVNEVVIKAMLEINQGTLDDINEALYLLGYKTLRNVEE